jgi:hypothetical protein
MHTWQGVVAPSASLLAPTAPTSAYCLSIAIEHRRGAAPAVYGGHTSARHGDREWLTFLTPCVQRQVRFHLSHRADQCRETPTLQVRPALPVAQCAPYKVKRVCGGLECVGQRVSATDPRN